MLGVAALAAGFRPLLKWWRLDCRGLPVAGGAGYGPLRPDPEGILDLPEGFSYRMLCRSGELMDDGFLVPGAPDGTGVFAMPNGEYRIVRNHELAAGQGRLGPFHGKKEPPPDRRYDPFCHGGTTTLVLDGELRLRRKFLSLAGTERNCAGGATPWGSWISCEESRAGPGSGKGYRRDHGFAFQVDAAADGLGEPVPLVAMGRFFREGAAVHPGRGDVYQTEDRADGCLYRFRPAAAGDLSSGTLSALKIRNRPGARTDNWGGRAAPGIPVGIAMAAEWVALDDPAPPEDTLRADARRLGAATFARGEGIVWDGGGAVFAATSGGPARLGQVWRYTPIDGDEGRLTLLWQSSDPCLFNMPDAIAVQPNGDLLVAEDNRRFSRLIGLSPRGQAYPFAYFRHDTMEELGGVAFSPDNRFMVVSAYEMGVTFLVTGPFAGKA